MERGVLFGIVFLLVISCAGAAELGICLNAHVTDISPTSITIGEEFTVGIEIDNCGYGSPNYVTFELKNVSPYIQVTDPLKMNIGKIEASSSNRFLLYHMRVTDEAVPGIYSIPYELVYGPNWNATIKSNGRIEIRLVGDEAKINIASSKTKPTLPEAGNTVELTLRLENYGDGTANSVKVEANHNFRGIKEAFIGTLDPDEDGPAVFTFVAPKSGEYNIPIKIIYTDDFGEHFIITSVNVTILKRQINIAGIILGILITGAFGFSIFYLIKKGKEKEEIIKQLLNNKPVKKKK